MKIRCKRWTVAFKNPPRNKVVIYAETCADQLKNFVLQDIPATTLAFDRNELFLSFRILLLTLVLVLRTGRVSDLARPKRALKKIYKCLLLGIVRAADPAVVITFVDNDTNFHWLSRHDSKARYFAIQNGVRPKLYFTHGEHYDFTNFFCLGELEKTEYSRFFAHSVDHYFPVGSLRASYYRHVVRRQEPEKLFDICLVSQFAPAFEDGDPDPVIAHCFKTLDQYLSRYARERRLKLAVLRRSAGENHERNYFHKFYGDAVTYIDSSQGPWSTYRGMDQSDVVISFFSTMGREAMVWGKKVLFFDASRTDLFHFPQKGVWLLEDGPYEDFKARLDEICQMTAAEYHEKISAHPDAAMNPEIKAHELIRQQILNAIAEHDPI